jgi:hypothetical protein
MTLDFILNAAFFLGSWFNSEMMNLQKSSVFCLVLVSFNFQTTLQECHEALTCTRPSSFQELSPWRTITTVLAFAMGRGVSGAVARRKSMAPPVNGLSATIVAPLPFADDTPFVVPAPTPHPSTTCPNLGGKEKKRQKKKAKKLKFTSTNTPCHDSLAIHEKL